MHPQARVDTGMPGNFTLAALITYGIWPFTSLPTVSVCVDARHNMPVVPLGQSASVVHDWLTLSPLAHTSPNGNGIDRKSLSMATPLVPGITFKPSSTPGFNGKGTSCSVVQLATQP